VHLHLSWPNLNLPRTLTFSLQWGKTISCKAYFIKKMLDITCNVYLLKVKNRIVVWVVEEWFLRNMHHIHIIIKLKNPKLNIISQGTSALCYFIIQCLWRCFFWASKSSPHSTPCPALEVFHDPHRSWALLSVSVRKKYCKLPKSTRSRDQLHDWGSQLLCGQSVGHWTSS
jgi:hypothetical protein